MALLLADPSATAEELEEAAVARVIEPLASTTSPAGMTTLVLPIRMLNETAAATLTELPPPSAVAAFFV